MATFDLPSFLTSPPLLLRLPASEKTYTLHRTLLQPPHTNLLTNTKRRTTTLQLPPGTHQSSLERVLEYLYTRRYDGLLSHGAGEEEDREEEGQHPVLTAAAKGAIGVWAGPKPVFTKARNWSSYTSIYVPGLQNAYDGEISASTTEFANYEPQLRDPRSQQYEEENQVENEDEEREKKRKQKQRPADPSQRLHAHLDIYFLSRRFEVLGLPEQVLAAISVEVRTHRFLLGELVREVYGTKTKDEGLRAFVVGLVAGEWGAWKGEEGVRRLLREGGEFVVDLVSRVKSF